MFYLTLISCCIACSDSTSTNPTPPSVVINSLKEANSRVLIGGYVRGFNQNPAIATITKEEFNVSQGLWYAGFGGWTSKGVYNFTDFNNQINFLKDNKIGTHIHMFVGPNFYMPNWLKNQTWTPEALDEQLKDMIEKIMESNDNKNKVDVWNVANEVFDESGIYRTDMVWNQMGWESDKSGLTGSDNMNDKHPIFIRKAFEYCRLKTKAKLEYRDYNIETANVTSFGNKKQRAVYQLLKHMIANKIPIDAIGIQGHYDIGSFLKFVTSSDLKLSIEKYKALGLEVYMTEVDFGTGKNADGTTKAWTTALSDQQKTDYYNCVKTAVQAGVSRFYTWGVVDGFDKGWRTDEYPLIWDKDAKKKSAYEGVKQGLIESK